MRAVRVVALVALLGTACTLLVPIEDDVSRGRLPEDPEAGPGADGATTDVAIDRSVPPVVEGGDGVAPVGCPPQTDPTLLVYYPFDEGAGTTARDCSGKGHDGVITGGATWTAGQRGGALVFDGMSTCVAPGNDVGNALESFSVAAWVNIESFARGATEEPRYIAARTTESNFDGWRFGTDDPSIVEFKIARSAGQAFYLGAPDGQPKGVWMHVGMVHVPSARAEVYINGALAVSSGSPPAIVAAPTARLRVGCFEGADYFFHGALDELRIYTRALEASDMQALAAR